MPNKFQQVKVNIVSKPRFAVMEGRDYIVLPVNILVEGVHSGSNGPTLYLLEDMEKYVPAWNHKPIVVYHPKKDGKFVSADDPAILSTSKVGILMANAIKGNAQQAEAWLEKSRLKEVDERVLKAIEEGIIVEVSTGLFSDNEENPGEWNGEPYDSIARNYRPDHLALLPDLVGACSISDGCGLFTASQKMTLNQAKAIKQVLTPEGVLNELSHGDIYSGLREKIKESLEAAVEIALESLPEGSPRPMVPYVDIFAVYDNYVVYSCGDYDSLYSQGYKKTKDSVELEGNPVPVQREVSYVPVLNQGDLDMSKPNTNCECKAEVKALVDKLISANKNWKEEDRASLQAMEEGMLKKLVSMQEEAPAPKKEEPKEDEAPAPTSNSTVIQKKKEVSVQEFIDNSPAPIREMLIRGLQAQEAEKKRYMDIIISNEANQFTEDDLKGMKPEMLQKLASLAVSSQEEEKNKQDKFLDMFSFIGGAGAPVHTANTKEEEALPLPVMNYAKLKEEKRK